VLKFLIEKRVPANYTDTLNQTVLYYAAREGKANCIDMLIASGIGF
jgi:ankyrin repeat protein